jgi:hypothetical protein
VIAFVSTQTQSAPEIPVELATTNKRNTLQDQIADERVFLCVDCAIRLLIVTSVPIPEKSGVSIVISLDAHLLSTLDLLLTPSSTLDLLSSLLRHNKP